MIDEVVTIAFVKSLENTSDLMMKNQQSVHFKSAQPKLVYTECWKPSSLLSNVHLRNTTKIAVQVLLLLTLFTFTFEPFLKL